MVKSSVKISVSTDMCCGMQTVASAVWQECSSSEVLEGSGMLFSAGLPTL